MCYNQNHQQRNGADDMTYKALLRPVSFYTLPDDVGRTWEFVHKPDTLEGGRYGVIKLRRELTKDEQDRFAMRPA